MTVQDCCLLVKQEVPAIDDDLYGYIQSVLENSAEDLAKGEDVYDAIGGLLHEVSANSSEEDIKKLCDKLAALLSSDSNIPDTDASEPTPPGITRILGAPVHLRSIVSQSVQNLEEQDSIWIQKSEDSSRVDSKKLEKAEMLLQKKQEKRDQGAGCVISNFQYKGSGADGEATASQAFSRRDDSGSQTGSSLTKDIRIDNLDLSFGDKVLLSGTNLCLISGRRYGLVGRNGLGKSTLLRTLSKRQVRIPDHVSILHVEQEVTGDDTLALQSVLESDTHREQLLQEESAINLKLQKGQSDPELNSRLSTIYAELEAIEADKAPSKASVILAGLGFSPEMQRQATKSFSGGWRMRLALARALFCQPDLLLLDEPTNMLDMQAIIWLERYLQNWTKTLLVVSHDRKFLDEVPTDILHLHSHRIDHYRGNYSEFESTMIERLKSQQREYEAQMDYRKHAQEFIDKFRYNAKRASLVQSRIKQLEKLPVLKPVEKESDVVLRFPDVDKLSPPILVLNEVSFSYGGNAVFSNVDLSATMESRICIVGENGAGKTTLLKLITDQLTPVQGTRSAHRNIKFGYFSQHHVDQLDMNVCPVELMQRHFPGKKTEEYRRMLGSFGVSGDLALQQIASLSGGQKSRVAFALMCAAMPNFLILDEPTNHLDIQTIEALGQALTAYKGGVILVSHDERLIRIVCQELWVCSRGRVYSLEGGFDQYRKLVEKELVLT